MIERIPADEAVRVLTYGLVIDSWLMLRAAHDPSVTVAPLFVFFAALFIVQPWIVDGVRWLSQRGDTES